MRNDKNPFLTLFLSLLICFLLIGCSPGVAAQPTPGQATAVGTAPIPTATLPPTATPLPGKVLLVAPAGAAAPAGVGIQPVQAALAELSGAAGLVFENRQSLQKEEITPEVRVVVSLDETINVAEMAAGAPQTQFVAVSPVDLPATANLTVIRQRLEKRAFVAGFISAILSTDYRAGGLLPGDGPLGDALQEAFTNGARYYCGVCAPGWPLNLYYPQVAALPRASDGASWQAAAAAMYDNQKVEVYYLSAEAARPEVIAYLLGKTQLDRPVLVVGDQTAPDELKAQWAATLRFDVVGALRQAWPDVTAGKGGAVVDAALIAENPTPDLVGEGRMRLVKELIAELEAGRVAPFSVPKE